MNDLAKSAPEALVRRYHPLRELVLCRLREFIREPEAIFWVYGFPMLMTLALGVAFKEKPIEKFPVDVLEVPGAQTVVEALQKQEGRFQVQVHPMEVCRKRLRENETDLIIIPTPNDPLKRYSYLYHDVKPESILAQRAVDEQLQQQAGRENKYKPELQKFEDKGGRYIDWLIPGLLGMGLMGGGLWGVGFVTVDMRIRNLLKRFLATPMRKSDFLLAIMTSRFIFMVPEMVILLTFAYFIFDVKIYGNILALLVLIILGAFTFSGIGLLVACRAKTIETVSGLMNVVMLPMWVLSGIFFSAKRFPEFMQPVIQALPLTQLNNALRAVMNDGQALTDQWPALLALSAWGLISFVLALKLFRWQ
jgi:ABC-type multidrug transport system permease subunit